MRTTIRWTAAIVFTLTVAPLAAEAQTFRTDDPVLQRIWKLGMEQSRASELAQILMDSVGPRLTGSPGQLAAHDWAAKTYASWGIEAENEEYGTWTGWRRGIHHVDLIAPRVKTLITEVPAWSAGTDGPVEAEVVLLPRVSRASEFEAWLPQARGKFVAIVPALLSCRPDRNFDEFGTPGALARADAAQEAASADFNRTRVEPTGLTIDEIRARLGESGARGLLQSRWRYDGTLGVSRSRVRTVPTIDLACEDYGLVYRLADNGQGPVLRANIDVEFTGVAPTYNTIATVPGTTNPDEYVMLSAHFDSWDTGSGATDNGTGTIVMMEAMRILAEVYPNPKRTIIAGHWSGEEQGLNGSEAWREDHPEVVQGMQALFNQDNGTGRVVRISTQGLTRASEYFARWLTQVPESISRHITVQSPATPGTGGTDSSSFICAGSPAFSLSAMSWDYGVYTHHTNLDTYDKIVPEDLRNNATLFAMLVYLASEDPEMVARDRRSLPAMAPGRGGRPAREVTEWPQCREPQRNDPQAGLIP